MGEIEAEGWGRETRKYRKLSSLFFLQGMARTFLGRVDSGIT